MAGAGAPSPPGLAGRSGGEGGGRPGSGCSGRPGAARFPAAARLPACARRGGAGRRGRGKGERQEAGTTLRPGLAGGREAARPRPGEDLGACRVGIRTADGTGGAFQWPENVVYLRMPGRGLAGDAGRSLGNLEW